MNGYIREYLGHEIEINTILLWTLPTGRNEYGSFIRIDGHETDFENYHQATAFLEEWGSHSCMETPCPVCAKWRAVFSAPSNLGKEEEAR